MTQRHDDGIAFWERWRSRSRLGRAIDIVLALVVLSMTMRAVVKNDWSDASFWGTFLVLSSIAFIADARSRRQ